MSIIVSGIKMPFASTEEKAVTEALKIVKASASVCLSSDIHKVSYDLRHNQLSKVVSVELELDLDEGRLVQKLNLPSVKERSKASMPMPSGEKKLENRPIIIGFGPAGLFAALVLAKNGYAPIVFERGGAIEERDLKVDSFFEGGELDLSSNVQFGEGGAGTYSDGKLTTRINDPKSQLVLDLLGEYGAEKEMLIKAKPHIGTDKLKGIVKAMREDIIRLGGEVHFNTKIADITCKDGKLVSVTDDKGNVYGAQTAIIAAGHSARDTFTMLRDRGFTLIPKAFSVGVRAEHLQSDIDYALYGKYMGLKGLPVGEYTLSRRADNRACYSFCMCPGGYVVAAASEENSVVTNGMSYHARSGRNANSAICVSVDPSDFGSSDPLAGMYFQRRIEQAAFKAVSGRNGAPVQLFGDFAEGRASSKLGRVEPTYPRGYEFVDINGILPGFVCDMIKSSMPYFGRKMKGFDAFDTVFTAPETRTSSPVRMTRGDDLMALGADGLIPCGEGAGYAGGIVSAAVDGIRSAARIMEIYSPER
ncbi:MAG: NAD(P)/FAD-dependent oxidoreductase [Clostridia bacterium]|nr:NAD(P)/FAD-dependent oxidoreductase [Clostridia bacterium]